jgi:enoyl-CoA hydratase/carnithine racemase
MDYVQFQSNEPIAILTLNRPKQRNALSLGLLNEILEILHVIKENDKIKVLIINGNGPDFCSGHDLNELSVTHQDISYFKNIFTVCTEMMETFHAIPQVVIAQVHGAATAAGCQLVAACDLAIASEEARFATPGVKLGLFCSTPMVPLSRCMNRKKALDMLFTGRFISAKEAMNFGLINKVVKKENLQDEAIRYAQEISQYYINIIALGKNAFYHQINLNEHDAYKYAIDVISKNCLLDEAQKGIKSHLDKNKTK